MRTCWALVPYIPVLPEITTLSGLGVVKAERINSGVSQGISPTIPELCPLPGTDDFSSPGHEGNMVKLLTTEEMNNFIGIAAFPGQHPSPGGLDPLTWAAISSVLPYIVNNGCIKPIGMPQEKFCSKEPQEKLCMPLQNAAIFLEDLQMNDIPEQPVSGLFRLEGDFGPIPVFDQRPLLPDICSFLARRKIAEQNLKLDMFGNKIEDCSKWPFLWLRDDPSEALQNLKRLPERNATLETFGLKLLEFGICERNRMPTFNVLQPSTSSNESDSSLVHLPADKPCNKELDIDKREDSGQPNSESSESIFTGSTSQELLSSDARSQSLPKNGQKIVFVPSQGFSLLQLPCGISLMYLTQTIPKSFSCQLPIPGILDIQLPELQNFDHQQPIPQRVSDQPNTGHGYEKSRAVLLHVPGSPGGLFFPEEPELSTGFAETQEEQYVGDLTQAYLELLKIAGLEPGEQSAPCSSCYCDKISNIIYGTEKTY